MVVGATVVDVVDVVELGGGEVVVEVLGSVVVEFGAEAAAEQPARAVARMAIDKTAPVVDVRRSRLFAMQCTPEDWAKKPARARTGSVVPAQDP